MRVMATLYYPKRPCLKTKKEKRQDFVGEGMAQWPQGLLNTQEELGLVPSTKTRQVLHGTNTHWFVHFKIYFCQGWLNAFHLTLKAELTLLHMSVVILYSKTNKFNFAFCFERSENT